MVIFSEQDRLRGSGQVTEGRRPDGSYQDLWRRFAQAATTKEFCESWLSLQCTMLPGVKNALLLLGESDHGPFTPAAIWPSAEIDVTHLVQPAEKALKERRGVLVRGAGGDAQRLQGNTDDFYVAYPIEISGRLHGVVVVEVEDLGSSGVQGLMQQLHWGASWLEVMLRRTEELQTKKAGEQLRKLLDGVAISVEHGTLQQTSLAFVTKLAIQFDCERVSLGFVERKKGIRVHTLSHSAGFGDKMNLVRAIGSAMDEAVDQSAVIVYPMPAGAKPVAAIAHAELSKTQGFGSICTVPLMEGARPFGALTLERDADKPFDEPTLDLIKTFGVLVGPIFNIKKREEQWLRTRIRESLAAQANKLTGPDHPGLKLVSGVLLLVLVFFVFAKGDHKVRSPIVLEGLVQRAITAPFNGYIAAAPARPGDVVRQGDLLCRLDDREIKLERLKWATQKEELLRQYSDAMAKHERAQVLIVQAKADQAEAQVNLADEELARIRLVAPFDGVVTSGDLSQSLGTPVERGQVLFEVAPLGGYRVIAQVDERDIGYVAPGQKGELELAAVPGEVLRFRVSKVTPVSTAKEGRNYFRVESKLEKNSTRLRPGMEGAGKIVVERRRLIWIWTHDMVEWVSLKLWTWWP